MYRQLLRTSVLILLLASSIHADTRSIGPDGINTDGLGLTGAGVVVGQVEEGRPGDVDNGDNAANRNSKVNPADGAAIALYSHFNFQRLDEFKGMVRMILALKQP